MEPIDDEHIIEELQTIEESYTALNWSYIDLVRRTNDKPLNDQTRKRISQIGDYFNSKECWNHMRMIENYCNDQHYSKLGLISLIQTVVHASYDDQSAAIYEDKRKKTVMYWDSFESIINQLDIEGLFYWSTLSKEEIVENVNLAMKHFFPGSKELESNIIIPDNKKDNIIWKRFYDVYKAHKGDLNIKLRKRIRRAINDRVFTVFG